MARFLRWFFHFTNTNKKHWPGANCAQMGGFLKSAAPLKNNWGICGQKGTVVFVSHLLEYNCLSHVCLSSSWIFLPKSQSSSAKNTWASSTVLLMFFTKESCTVCSKYFTRSPKNSSSFKRFSLTTRGHNGLQTRDHIFPLAHTRF